MAKGSYCLQKELIFTICWSNHSSRKGWMLKLFNTTVRNTYERVGQDIAYGHNIYTTNAARQR
jgi:hypothetical protein